jgi:hypothetical protein
MSSLEFGLHFSKLMLNTVHLDTSIFTLLFDFSNFFLFFTELKINALVLIGQLFGQGSLESSHEVMIGWKVSNVSSIIKILVYIFLIFSSYWSFRIKAKSSRTILKLTTKLVITIRLLNAKEIILNLPIWINTLVKGLLYIL